MRAVRRYDADPDDQRSAFARDRDRILYSSAFRRLDGITQIVRAGESDVFHNRLIHTLKVAQVGRRLAEHLLKNQPEESSYFGLDVEVVEAACLGHDLGHPPFGHVGEKVLNELLSIGDPPKDADGYEGNAQSFRVVTKLSVRFPDCDGLNLTRATLAALLKYPWARNTEDKGKTKKWGFYRSEQEDFDFCSEDGKKSLEAELMDWADDIAYSVHDLEDFHRCNFIPWAQIFDKDAGHIERIIENIKTEWFPVPPDDAADRMKDAWGRIGRLFQSVSTQIITHQYDGSRDQRSAIRTITSMLIGRYLQATQINEISTKINEQKLKINENTLDEVRFLKQITREYILRSPALVAQQRGQGRILRNLFNDIHEDLLERKPKFVPRRFRHLAADESIPIPRVASDCIASLTEGEAIALHKRLHGESSGSVLDPIVR